MTPTRTLPRMAAILALAGLAIGPLNAQEDGATAPQAEPETPQTQPGPDPAQPSGETTGDAANAVGRSYVAETFTDWQQRCIRTESGDDPCQLYQLLRDDNGNAVSEISVFALPEGQQAEAGATIITPLETYLPAQLSLQIDSGETRRYQFDFCAQQGCFARVGLTEAEVNAMKRGNVATITIVPFAAQDQQIELEVSLSGFTAGYDAVEASNAG